MKLQMIKGFLWVRYDVFDNKNLNASDLLTYMGLMRYMNNQTCTCYPSLTKLEEMSGLTRKTIYKSLAHLEEEGLVAISKEDGKVNHYLMLEPKQGNYSPSTRVNELPELGEISPPNNTNPNNTKKTIVATESQRRIIEHLNERLGKKPPKGFKVTNQRCLRDLNARLREYFEADIIAVIDKKCDDWMGTQWQKFLRPITLFNVNKFESYVNEIDVEGNQNEIGTLKELE